MKNRLSKLKSIKYLDGLKVCLLFDDGLTAEVSFDSTISKGGIFAKLANPVFFKKVKAAKSGRYIYWPGGLDFCADALRIKATTTE